MEASALELILTNAHSPPQRDPSLDPLRASEIEVLRFKVEIGLERNTALLSIRKPSLWGLSACWLALCRDTGSSGSMEMVQKGLLGRARHAVICPGRGLRVGHQGNLERAEQRDMWGGGE